MAASTDKYVVFLLCAVLIADAAPSDSTAPALSPAKHRQLDRILSERFPALSLAQRRTLVAKTLSGMPKLSGGLSFLRLIERSARKIGGVSPDLARQVLVQMAAVARAKGPLSPPERTVLRAALKSLGLKDSVRIQERAEDGRFRIASC